ncbi:MAG TPA: ParB/RepB/Spo0J family partition protein [Hyphomicrobiales bacterium]|mgnify:CR=1 FL=1|nr:ParB/RepB/Spo0J family partition protein [Hyphomicrobiales bacterium]
MTAQGGNAGGMRGAGGEDAARPKRLGRGLAALIGDMGNETDAPPRNGSTQRVPTAFLRPNPHNPRKSFAADQIEDLANSIREKGIVQPIIVRSVDGEADHFEIVAGERRWRAAQRAGLHEVPVLVYALSDREALEVAVVENVQRADLNPIEEALGYQQLIGEFDYTQEALAKVIGKSRSHVANMMRLLKLPAGVQDYLKAGELSAGHARALITHPDPEALARRIVELGFSVRDTESAANAARNPRPAGQPGAVVKDADTLSLEKALGDVLGMRVSISHRGGEGGELKIAYRSLEQLDDICRRLKGGH